MQTVWYKVANINKNMDEHLTTNSEDHIDETTIHWGEKKTIIYIYIYMNNLDGHGCYSWAIHKTPFSCFQ